MTIEATKRCYICGFELPLGCFNSKRKECKECQKGLRLIDRYGITREKYNEMLEAQGGTCAICPYTPKPGEMLAVDHNHKCCPGRKSCGKCVRKLLCDKCNRGLGYFLDSIDSLLKASEYIKSFERSVDS